MNVIDVLPEEIMQVERRRDELHAGWPERGIPPGYSEPYIASIQVTAAGLIRLSPYQYLRLEGKVFRVREYTAVSPWPDHLEAHIYLEPAQEPVRG